MKNIVIATLLIILSPKLWADKTFDSLFTLLNTREDLYAKDTSSNGYPNLILEHLQQHPDTSDILKWTLKITNQKNYFKKKSDDETYALLGVWQLCAYNNFGNVLSRAEEDSIITEAKSFLPILKKYKQYEQYALALFYLGDYYFTKNDNKALAYFLLAMPHKGTNGWINYLSAEKIGVIYRRAGNYEKAIEYLKMSLYYNPANIYISALISYYYAHIHQCDSAKVYFHLAEKFIDNRQVNFKRAKAYNFLCEQQYDSAQKYLVQCVVAFDTVSPNSIMYYYLIEFNRDLYKIYKIRHETEKQQTILNRIHYYSNNLKYDVVGIQAATMGFELLENDAFEKGNFKDAYEYKTRLEFLRDSSEKLGALNVFETIQTQNDYEQKLAAFEVESEHKESKMQKQKTIGWMAAIVLALMGMLAFIQFRNNKKIKIEKNRSDSLLLNILPEEVAEELKTNGSTNAKLFENVTVLFTDFVDFTKASERMAPQELVEELHNCFKAFDEITSRYGIEKIKTVGDAYLSVCGLPLADEKHAEMAVKAAIEIKDFIENRFATLGDKTFQVRIGVHTGSVVAGIVGVKKFAYDIWGDTVNIAARMEQSSKAGKINISETTYELVKDKFTCEYRGEIEAKNKGKLKMYFVRSTI